MGHYRKQLGPKADIDYDAIIGMDIITKGDFHLDSMKGKTVFEFTLP